MDTGLSIITEYRAYSLDADEIFWAKSRFKRVSADSMSRRREILGCATRRRLSPKSLATAACVSHTVCKFRQRHPAQAYPRAEALS
jgi:hypothetical protein